MIQVGDEHLGYLVVAFDGDMVTILTPSAIAISFSVSGIVGGLREVLGLIGIKGV